MVLRIRLFLLLKILNKSEQMIPHKKMPIEANEHTIQSIIKSPPPITVGDTVCSLVYSEDTIDFLPYLLQ